MKKILFTFLILITITNNVWAQESSKNKTDIVNHAKSAILIEASTGKVLYAKNENEKLAPASMTKIMSLLLIMGKIDNHDIKLTDKVPVSENASGMGGSQIFLETGSNVSVKEILKGITIASANDAVVAMAEYIGGTEDEFVKMMNKKAKELGLKNTEFKNCHGLDEDNHYSSAKDMAIIAKELIKHEDILNYSKIYEDYFTKPDGNKIWLVNTNKLVRFYDGVDGLKTGYTSKAGYCLTATAKKNNLRVISVVMGSDTSANRNSDTTNLLNYAFSNYKVDTLISKNKNLGKVKINRGKKEYGNLVLKNDATILLKNSEKSKKYTYKIKKNNITAPIKKGEKVATLQIYYKNKLIKEEDLTIKEDILKANFFDIYLNTLKQIFGGKKLF